MEEKVVQVAMQVILHAGNARNLIRNSGNLIVDNKLDGVEEMLAEAKKEIILAHKAQTELLQNEAKGNKIEMSILFSHAQDTLMTTDSECFIIETLYKTLRRR